ncbi:OLC1v1014787C1 [Oldenlandia corymbosa var. corymbosa]|uniref:protein disulfide-isomerase n=1 Tax=Oldenlandia corymbosa var. corymbosa TaxID=529605 RepID=A0AAV1E5B6_OLDCO|nr:OLC1v1014787C1 [Oldenlandia corymbosa var. corymbosa]
MEGIEELMALDEEVGVQQSPDGIPHQGTDKLSGAQVLSKAQRIVLELNVDNAKRVVADNEYVMVLGYAPWCSRSAELMPRFAEAATTLKELGSPVLMAKLDAERYPKAASTLEIKGIPTLLLFVNGTPQTYSGGFTSEDIVIWIRKKTGAPIIRVSSVDEANEFLKKHSKFVVGLFPGFEGSEYEEFVKAAASENELQFIESSSLEVVKVLFPEAKHTKVFIGLTKSEPERYSAFDGTLTAEEILQFLGDNKFPLVTVLTELNAPKVYSVTQKLQVFVFADADDMNKLTETLQGVARKFKSKIMLVLVDIREDNLAKPFLSLFGIEGADDTIVTAFDYHNNVKYLLESDPTPANIEEFCLGLSDGKLSPFYKSQPVPSDKGTDVLAVVGKTFDDLVLKSPKNILLEVYTPWCMNCDATTKQVEKLAKHFKGLENLIFARIDASANEHPNLQVEEYPTLLFYTAKDKKNPIKFSTKSSSKDMAALINKSLKEQDDVTKDEL